MSPGAASYSSHPIPLYCDSNILWTEQFQKLHGIQSRSPIFRFRVYKVLCKISKLIRILSSMKASSLLSTQSCLNTYSHILSIIGDGLLHSEFEERYAVMKKRPTKFKKEAQ